MDRGRRKERLPEESYRSCCRQVNKQCSRIIDDLRLNDLAHHHHEADGNSTVWVDLQSPYRKSGAPAIDTLSKTSINRVYKHRNAHFSSLDINNVATPCSSKENSYPKCIKDVCTRSLNPSGSHNGSASWGNAHTGIDCKAVDATGNFDVRTSVSSSGHSEQEGFVRSPLRLQPLSAHSLLELYNSVPPFWPKAPLKPKRKPIPREPAKNELSQGVSRRKSSNVNEQIAGSVTPTAQKIHVIDVKTKIYNGDEREIYFGSVYPMSSPPRDVIIGTTSPDSNYSKEMKSTEEQEQQSDHNGSAETDDKPLDVLQKEVHMAPEKGVAQAPKDEMHQVTRSLSSQPAPATSSSDEIGEKADVEARLYIHTPYIKMARLSRQNRTGKQARDNSCSRTAGKSCVTQDSKAVQVGDSWADVFLEQKRDILGERLGKYQQGTTVNNFDRDLKEPEKISSSTAVDDMRDKMCDEDNVISVHDDDDAGHSNYSCSPTNTPRRAGSNASFFAHRSGSSCSHQDGIYSQEDQGISSMSVLTQEHSPVTNARKRHSHDRDSVCSDSSVHELSDQRYIGVAAVDHAVCGLNTPQTRTMDNSRALHSSQTSLPNEASILEKREIFKSVPNICSIKDNVDEKLCVIRRAQSVQIGLNSTNQSKDKMAKSKNPTRWWRRKKKDSTCGKTIGALVNATLTVGTFVWFTEEDIGNVQEKSSPATFRRQISPTKEAPSSVNNGSFRRTAPSDCGLVSASLPSLEKDGRTVTRNSFKSSIDVSHTTVKSVPREDENKRSQRFDSVEQTEPNQRPRKTDLKKQGRSFEERSVTDCSAREAVVKRGCRSLDETPNGIYISGAVEDESSCDPGGSRLSVVRPHPKYADSAPRTQHQDPSHSMVTCAMESNSQLGGKSGAFDIVGGRFPWQRDVGVQCTLLTTSNAAVITNGDSNTVTMETQQKDSQKQPTSTAGRQKKKLLVKSISVDVPNGDSHVYVTRPSNFRQVPGSPRVKEIRNQEWETLHKSPALSDSDLEIFEGQQKVAESKGRLSTLTACETRSTCEIKRSGSSSIRRRKQLKRASSVGSTAEADLDVGMDAVPSSELVGRSDTLPSPRVSPVPWMHPSLPKLVVTSTKNQEYLGGNPNMEARTHKDSSYLRVPSRRAGLGKNSSCSLTSASDESDTEQSPFELRRGRRSAVIDPKGLGVVSAPDGDLSPGNSCDESEIISDDVFSSSTESAAAEPPRSLGRRKRSSADLGVNYPGDLVTQNRKVRAKPPPLIKRNTIADFANTKAYQASTASIISAVENDLKKIKGSRVSIFNKFKTKGSKSELGEVLANLKASEFTDNFLKIYKDAHWSLLVDSDPDSKERVTAGVEEPERKRREAVWELFQSECVFLLDHLMVLKHCFMEPMKEVQVEGNLMFAEPRELFGNLDDLCWMSKTFCRDFLTLLLKDIKSSGHFGRTEVLTKALQKLSQLTTDGELYHEYCLNYSKAITYLDQLRKNEDFCQFEKWCEQDRRCHRLQLTDLLVSPMQHCTKVPLLLNNIRKYTSDEEECRQLTVSIEKLETSLKNLEAKMKWLKNFERVQEIQQQIVWQPITELEPRALIPEFLKPTLNKQPCERLLASPKRQLLHEGAVTLLEIYKTIDMYMFLFDDILLLTKVKKQPKKKQSLESAVPSGHQTVQTDGAKFVVHRQPMALDRVTVHDVQPPDAAGIWEYWEAGSSVHLALEGDHSHDMECLPHFIDDYYSQRPNLFFGCLSAANGLKNAFVLVQISRFQQIIGVYTLQAPSENAKALWLNKLHEAQEKYKEASKPKSQDSNNNDSPAHRRSASLKKTKSTRSRNKRSSTGSQEYPPGHGMTLDLSSLPLERKAISLSNNAIITSRERSSSSEADGIALLGAPEQNRRVSDPTTPLGTVLSPAFVVETENDELETHSVTMVPSVTTEDIGDSNEAMNEGGHENEGLLYAPQSREVTPDDTTEDNAPLLAEPASLSAVSSPSRPRLSPSRTKKLSMLNAIHEKSQSIDTGHVYI